MELDAVLKKQFIRFFISGVTAVAIDLMVYYVLKETLDYNLAKGVSFLAGTIVAYILNKFWTFEEKKYSSVELIKFFTLYSLTLFINIYINHLALIISQSVLFAFLTATGVSTVLNFVGQKFWVFKK